MLGHHPLPMASPSFTLMQFNAYKLNDPPRMDFKMDYNPFPASVERKEQGSGSSFQIQPSTLHQKAADKLWNTYIRGPLLGSGVLGSVYYGMHELTKEVVGIKYISFTKQDGEFSCCTAREFAVIHPLRHCSVVLQ